MTVTADPQRAFQWVCGGKPSIPRPSRLAQASGDEVLRVVTKSRHETCGRQQDTRHVH